MHNRSDRRGQQQNPHKTLHSVFVWTRSTLRCGEGNTALMFLALTEMKRAKTRFGLLIAAIGMLVFLILFQQSLQNGLITSFVGAIRHQNAPVLVYTVDGQRSLQNSVIPNDLETLVHTTPSAAASGRIGLTMSSAANNHGDLVDTVVVGFESVGMPTRVAAGRVPVAPNEAIANSNDADRGYALGDTLTLKPGNLDITIVGHVDDIQFMASPTIFVSYNTYLDAIVATNPSANTPLPNAIAVQPRADTTPTALAAEINAASDDLDALTRTEAATLAPGVAQVRQSFTIIFALYGLVIPCVTGLFFLIITFQKADSLTLLRAFGAPASQLVSPLLIQATLIVGAGYALGLACYTPLAGRRLGGISLSFETRAVVAWAVFLLALGVTSSLVAVRRVLAIDPIEATTGGSRR